MAAPGVASSPLAARASFSPSAAESISSIRSRLHAESHSPRDIQATSPAHTLTHTHTASEDEDAGGALHLIRTLDDALSVLHDVTQASTVPQHDAHSWGDTQREYISYLLSVRAVAHTHPHAFALLPRIYARLHTLDLSALPRIGHNSVDAVVSRVAQYVAQEAAAAGVHSTAARHAGLAGGVGRGADGTVATSEQDGSTGQRLTNGSVDALDAVMREYGWPTLSAGGEDSSREQHFSLAHRLACALVHPQLLAHTRSLHVPPAVMDSDMPWARAALPAAFVADVRALARAPDAYDAAAAAVRAWIGAAYACGPARTETTAGTTAGTVPRTRASEGSVSSHEVPAQTIPKRRSLAYSDSDSDSGESSAMYTPAHARGPAQHSPSMLWACVCSACAAAGVEPLDVACQLHAIDALRVAEFGVADAAQRNVLEAFVREALASTQIAVSPTRDRTRTSSSASDATATQLWKLVDQARASVGGDAGMLSPVAKRSAARRADSDVGKALTTIFSQAGDHRSPPSAGSHRRTVPSYALAPISPAVLAAAVGANDVGDAPLDEPRAHAFIERWLQEQRAISHLTGKCAESLTLAEAQRVRAERDLLRDTTARLRLLLLLRGDMLPASPAATTALAFTEDDMPAADGFLQWLRRYFPRLVPPYFTRIQSMDARSILDQLLRGAPCL